VRIAAFHQNAWTARAESTRGNAVRFKLGSNPDPDPDDHQRYEDHRHVDRDPPGHSIRRLFGHGLIPLRRILQRKIASGCELVHIPWNRWDGSPKLPKLGGYWIGAFVFVSHFFTFSPALPAGGWLQMGDRIALSPAGVSLIAVCCFSPRLSIQP